jgi:hypothetical protein
VFDLQAGGGRSGYLGAVRPDVRGGAKDVVLRVSLGVELAGILLDAQGNPVATTSLMADDGSRTAAMRPYDQVGPDGRFLLRGLARGRVRLTAQRGEAHVPVGEVEAPGADVRLTLPAR